MCAFIKKDLKNMFPFVWMMMGFSLFAYLIGFSEIPFASYLVFFLITFVFLFYYENKQHVNRFFVSLPIKKTSIVLTRYVSILLTVIMMVTIILVIESIFTHRFDGYEFIHYAFVFTAILSFTAICLPFNYIFDNFIIAYFVQLFLYGALAIPLFIISYTEVFDPVVSLFLTILDWQPLLTLSMFTIGLIIVSYIISCRIFIRKFL